MIVCLCNPFSDKKVQKHLSEAKEACKVSEVYDVCSDGEKPQCCSCIETLKDIVKTHNETVAA